MVSLQGLKPGLSERGSLGFILGCTLQSRSSEPSVQSASPSQTHVLDMQVPSSHINHVSGLQFRASPGPIKRPRPRLKSNSLCMVFKKKFLWVAPVEKNDSGHKAGFDCIWRKAGRNNCQCK